jgi:hypothetical protein
MGGACRTHGMMTDAYKILIAEPDEYKLGKWVLKKRWAGMY